MTGGSLLSVSLSTLIQNKCAFFFFLFIFGAEKCEDPLESKSLHFFFCCKWLGDLIQFF